MDYKYNKCKSDDGIESITVVDYIDNLIQEYKNKETLDLFIESPFIKKKMKGGGYISKRRE